MIDTNGLPVPGVLLQPDGGTARRHHRHQRQLLVSVPPAGTVHVTPSSARPDVRARSRTYNDVTANVSNENYLAVGTIAPIAGLQVQTNTSS